MRNNLIVPALLAFAVFAAVSNSTAAIEKPPVPLKIYCDAPADPSGFVDARSQGRSDSLKDLQENIQKKHADWLQLVGRREDADIVVQIVDRYTKKNGNVDITSRATRTKDGKSATGYSQSTEHSDYVVKAIMYVGDYKNELAGTVSDEFVLGGFWKTAAANIGGELEKWAKANYNKVIADRPKK